MARTGNSLAAQVERAELRLRLEKAKRETEQARLTRAAAASRRKMLATYDGAKRDRRDRDWMAKSLSADAAYLPDQATLVNRSRAMVRDYPHGTSVVEAYDRNVVGRGIMPASAARFLNGNEKRTFNDAADRLFFAWADNPLTCDIEGKRTFWDFQAWAVTEWVTAGEAFLVFVGADNGPSLPPMQLQGIESEQLDCTRLRNQENGNEIRNGVEINQYGRPVAYWIFQQPPNDLGLRATVPTSTRIPADRVIHFYTPTRVRQTRGVTRLHAVLRKLRDLGEYDSLELWMARMQACVGMGIEMPSSGSGSDVPPIGLMDGEGGDEQDDAGNREINWHPGMVFVGKAGEKLVPFTPNRPGGQYDPFTKAQLRAVGAGSGLSYEQVARDFTNGSYSSQRQSLLEDRRGWTPLQQRMILTLCAPVRNEFLTVAVLAGLLQAPQFFQHRSEMLDCEWYPDGWGAIDEAKHAAAAKIGLEQRITTRTRILTEQGLVFRSTMRQLGDERDMAAEVGITFPEDRGPTPINPAEPRPSGVSRDAQGEGTTLPEDDNPSDSENQGQTMARPDTITEAVIAEAMR